MSGADSTRGADSAEQFVRRLHRDHGNALYTWARRRFGDARDAEEAVAETLLRAWRNHHQYDPVRGSERSWLFGIARTTAADQYRRNRRHLSLISSEAPDEPVEDLPVEQVAEATLVHEALMDLPEHHRVVIIEAYFAGRTSTEIAERLHIPPGTVKSRLYYGMRALRAALEERGILR